MTAIETVKLTADPETAKWLTRSLEWSQLMHRFRDLPYKRDAPKYAELREYVAELETGQLASRPVALDILEHRLHFDCPRVWSSNRDLCVLLAENGTEIPLHEGWHEDDYPLELVGFVRREMADDAQRRNARVMAEIEQRRADAEAALIAEVEALGLPAEAAGMLTPHLRQLVKAGQPDVVLKLVTKERIAKAAKRDAQERERAHKDARSSVRELLCLGAHGTPPLLAPGAYERYNGEEAADPIELVHPLHAKILRALEYDAHGLQLCVWDEIERLEDELAERAEASHKAKSGTKTTAGKQSPEERIRADLVAYVTAHGPVATSAIKQDVRGTTKVTIAILEELTEAGTFTTSEGKTAKGRTATFYSLADDADELDEDASEG